MEDIGKCEGKAIRLGFVGDKNDVELSFFLSSFGMFGHL